MTTHELRHPLLEIEQLLRKYGHNGKADDIREWADDKSEIPEALYIPPMCFKMWGGMGSLDDTSFDVPLLTRRRAEKNSQASSDRRRMTECMVQIAEYLKQHGMLKSLGEHRLSCLRKDLNKT